MTSPQAHQIPIEQDLTVREVLQAIKYAKAVYIIAGIRVGNEYDNVTVRVSKGTARKWFNDENYENYSKDETTGAVFTEEGILYLNG